MTWWNYLLLVNLYLVLFYMFYTLLLRKETFFQLNRVYLVSSALLSFFIPVMQAEWVKNLFITQRVQYSIYSSPISIYQFKPVEVNHVTIGQIIIYIYITGVAFLTIRLIWQLLSLKKIINQQGSASAFSFFKNIRLGNELSNRDVIEAHEHVHMNQWHSADILLIETISIINWFNPVVYLYRLSIKHIHEFIADRQALRAGTDKTEYALLLLSQTFETPAHRLVNPFFNHSLLKQRIIMLQKNRSRYSALLKYGLTAPLFILMLILSSATINKSKTISIINRKAQQVFLLQPSLSAPVADANLPEPDTKVIKGNIHSVVPVKQDINNEPIQGTIDTTYKGPIFTSVEQSPDFPGGVSGFSAFLAKNIRYPESMRKNNAQGKVFMSFIIEKDGSLSDIKAVRDFGYGGAEESTRVLKLSPKWNPGVQNGRPVRVQYIVPINFSLEKKQNYGSTSGAGLIKGKLSDIKITYNDNLKLPAVNGDTAKKIVLNVKTVDPKLQPLYLLDGKEISDLSKVNPNDIDAVSVLKSDSKHNYESLYGAKASNGVIIITTKKALLKLVPAQ